jgi:hypothetical protein
LNPSNPVANRAQSGYLDKGEARALLLGLGFNNPMALAAREAEVRGSAVGEKALQTRSRQQTRSPQNP